MSYILEVYWKNCPKWNPQDDFLTHLLSNVSLDIETTINHISIMQNIPFKSITQSPSTDPDIGWITIFQCDDMSVINSLQDFYNNVVVPTLVVPREIILSVTQNAN